MTFPEYHLAHGSESGRVTDQATVLQKALLFGAFDGISVMLRNGDQEGDVVLRLASSSARDFPFSDVGGVAFSHGLYVEFVPAESRFDREVYLWLSGN